MKYLHNFWIVETFYAFVGALVRIYNTDKEFE